VENQSDGVRLVLAGELDDLRGEGFGLLFVGEGVGFDLRLVIVLGARVRVRADRRQRDVGQGR